MSATDTFDCIVELAARLFAAPIALVTEIVGDRQVFRAKRGFEGAGTRIEDSFCAQMLALPDTACMVVEDAALDPKFADNRLVTELGVRFYAGAVITTPDGKRTGGLCVIDTEPRPAPAPEQIESLKLLAKLAGEQLAKARLEQQQNELVGTFKLAEDLAGIGAWRLDVDSGRVTWSDQVYRIHGVDPASFDPNLGDAIGFYHPDDREGVRRWCLKAITSGQGDEFQMRLIRADGEERLVVSKCRPDVRNGQTVALYGVFQDVTERVRADASLVESEARYRLIANNTRDVIVTYGLDGNVHYASPSIEAALGISPADLVGKPISALVHPDDVAGLDEAYRRTLESGHENPHENLAYRCITADGAIRWFESRPCLVRNSRGQPVAIQDSVRDITAKKQLEEDLIQARDAAEQAARAKSDFLANMSHELRTPLTSVIGFSELLKDSPDLPPTEKGYAARIATSSRVLLEVINDILDYSKLEANAVELDLQPFSPVEMLQTSASIVEPLCAAKGLTLHLDLAPDLPPTVMGDGARLRQIVLNLLSNAVKFTRWGDVRVEAAWQAGRLRVSVSDSGIGIAPGKIATLFDRFTQADASTTRLYGGTGLGLAISQRLIRLMGGDIGATSRPGEGSTFWFEAPLDIAASDVAASEATSLDLPPGLRILMADDAAANRELVRIILSAWDIQLETVENGAEAVQAAAGDTYDLILMDLQMPVMDGMAATRAIRELDSPAATTPILALTACVQPDHVANCMAAGMNGHVGKPIQVGQLIQAIAEALARHGVDAAGRRAA